VAIPAAAIEAFAQDLRRYRDDPVAWCRDVLCLPLIPGTSSPFIAKQEEVARSVVSNRRTLAVSCNGVGKTYLAAGLVHWWFHTRPNSYVVTTATTWTQVRNVLWGEINSMHDARLGSICLDVEIRPPIVDGQRRSKWRALGLSVKHASRMQGYHAPEVFVVIDEGQGVAQEIWDAASRITVSKGSRQLALCNPVSRRTPDYAYSQRPDIWSVIRITSDDHPNVQTGQEVIPGAITREWVEEMRALLGDASPLFRSSVLAEYPSDDDWAVMPIGPVKSALDLWGEDDFEVWDQDHHFGLDVARLGDDRTVLVHRLGMDVLDIWSWSKADTMQTVGLATERVASVGGRLDHLRVDVGGLGGGVVDRFHELSHRVIAVNFGEGPQGDLADIVGQKTLFKNRRAELYWAARRLFEDRRVRLRRGRETDALMADLCAVNYSLTSKNEILLEPKEEVKRRIGRSPDAGDALVISLAGFLRPSPARIAPRFESGAARAQYFA